MPKRVRNYTTGSQKSLLHKVINVDIMDGDEVPEIPIGFEIGLQACASAIVSGINGMAKEGGKSLEAYRGGKIDQKQFTYRIIHKGTESAIKGGARTASGLALSEGAKHYISKKFGQAVLKRFTISIMHLPLLLSLLLTKVLIHINYIPERLIPPNIKSILRRT
ncbi:MAG: hypothetical protein R3B93_11570 [Bacteroidia bacterium]